MGAISIQIIKPTLLQVVIMLVKVKLYRGVEVHIHLILTSALDGGEWLNTRLSFFTPVEGALGTHRTVGSASHRTGLDVLKKYLMPPPSNKLQIIHTIA
jgi:hypothetical protein